MSQSNTLQILGTFAGVCVVNVSAVTAVWIQVTKRSGRTDVKIDEVSAGVTTAADKADVAADKADIVAKRVEPISNGFAASVLAKLSRIEEGQAAHSEELARAREEIRETRTELHRHIGDHAAADVRRRHTD